MPPLSNQPVLPERGTLPILERNWTQGLSGYLNSEIGRVIDGIALALGICAERIWFQAMIFRVYLSKGTGLLGTCLTSFIYSYDKKFSHKISRRMERFCLGSSFKDIANPGGKVITVEP